MRLPDFPAGLALPDYSVVLEEFDTNLEEQRGGHHE